MPSYQPMAIALPCLGPSDLESYLQKATEEFVQLKTNATGGRENVVITISDWNIDDYEQLSPSHSDFELPIQLKVEFMDDHFDFKGNKNRVDMGIVLRGLESFTLEPSNMITYQIFKVEATPHVLSDKRDYKHLLLKWMEYLSSRKLGSYSE
ncbi:hypothetical protein [Neobacillus sp. PS2-9]|uniref:hypothetical protein n=1 Tax=Neobacillus sp. PS2-9 TaxID=3070676 RepID=UPI0027E0106F|nr:hypothetical protein [Neobacillus sp. PS2-9]WML56561.1 hypothetical protein RCG25_16680 [Neobacillus sp. PS2-9]